ncbi:MAG: CRISPR-associated endonuclease Cas2 [Thermoplasmata archaeon]
MYVVVVYDVNVDRVNKVRKFLKTHLTWVQNSVLQGNVTKAELRGMKSKLKDIVDTGEDSVLIYKVRTEKYIDRDEIGTTKGETDKII